MIRAFTLAVAIALSFASPTAAQSTAQPEIDLKLFETQEVDRSKGCSVALWQATAIRTRTSSPTSSPRC
jgi:hypothetical protein